MRRNDFIAQLSILTAGACLPALDKSSFFSDESPFARHIKPIGRVLEMEGYYVWCNSPIEDDQGKIHVFFSRWNAKKGMGGWINGCEIAHAVADVPVGPYQFLEIVLALRRSTTEFK
jgi:hypothetical protein